MSKSPQRAKVQHYVPQFLLRNFASGKNQRLYAFDKLNGRSFRSNPRNLAAEGGFYDFEHDGKQRSFEPFMARMETAVSRVMGGIVRQESLGNLTRDDRVSLSLFAAVQLLRVKTVRDRLRSINTGLRDAIARRGIDPGDVVPKMDDEAIKHDSISQISMAKEFSKYFYEKAWILHRAPAGTDLYISDNPITLHNLVREPGRSNLGLMSVGIEIYLPISSRLSICFFCSTMHNSIHENLQKAAEFTRRFGTPPVDVTPLERIAKSIATGSADPLLPENVVHQNSLQVLFSSRFVFSRNGDFDLVKSMIAENPQLRYPPEMVIE